MDFGPAFLHNSCHSYIDTVIQYLTYYIRLLGNSLDIKKVLVNAEKSTFSRTLNQFSFLISFNNPSNHFTFTK